MGRRKLVICKVCGWVVKPNTGIPKQSIHIKCAETLPCDLIIQRGKSRIEIKTALCSKRKLQKIARLFVTNYQGGKQ